MSKRRIALAELQLGSAIPWDAFDEKGVLLFRKGQVVSSESQLRRLVERGLFAEMAAAREAAPAPAVEEAPSAVSLILEARRRLQLVCAPVGRREDFPEQVMSIVQLIGQACILSQEAALATALLQKNGRYSIRHSVDAAVACHVIGATTELSPAELASTVAGALTMNISILQLQDDLQGQQQPLTPGQREVIQQHPEGSVEMLRELGVLDEVWLSAVLSHHEAIDGSGYRQRKKGDQIPVPAQLVSLSDIYCARISSRDYRAGMRPNAALRALFLEQGKKVRDGLASQFIKAIGVFPPGTPVRLENGEIGLVTQRGEAANAPVVCSVIGPRGMPLAAPIRRDTGRPTYGVREVVDWTDLGAIPPMQALWGRNGAVH